MMILVFAYPVPRTTNLEIKEPPSGGSLFLDDDEDLV
ncbi:hypothetical protein BDW_13420 [Bdellovibrio bacteriovorus W]|nr:hypothetical protein BDW_13420 [Bdellovibrio bacteriovorus W]